MRTGSRPGGATFLLVLGWILLIAGLAIVVYEILRGEGIGLVGAGVAAVGGITVWSESRKNAAGSSHSEEGG